MKTAGGGCKFFAEKDDFLRGEHAAFLDPKPKELKAKQELQIIHVGNSTAKQFKVL